MTPRNKQPQIFAGNLLSILILLLCCSCAPSERSRTILPNSVELRPGDVVFRRGGGLTSRIVCLAEGDGDYSHTGIVVDSAGVCLIVHAVPDEPNYPGEPEHIKADRPEVFFSTMRASCGAVCRYTDSIGAAVASRRAWQLYRQGILFDHSYDATDTTRLCCTQLVTYSYACAGITLVDAPLRTFSIVGVNVRCHMPSDLLHSSHLKQLYNF